MVVSCGEVCKDSGTADRVAAQILHSSRLSKKEFDREARLSVFSFCFGDSKVALLLVS